MNRLIAIFTFVLSLYGCDVGGSTFVDRSDTLYSKVVAHAGVARFECVRSASGQCHYTVFPPGCATTPAAAAGVVRGSSANSTDNSTGRCPSAPLNRFAIANGSSRLIAGLQYFHVCVSTDGGAPTPDCEAPGAMAAR